MDHIVKTGSLDTNRGLSDYDVEQRIARQQVNRIDNRSSRSIQEILRSNILTLFNAILGSALVCVLVIGSWPDAVFGCVMILNAVTGILSELKAKRTLDKLAILDAPTATVIREGKTQVIPASDVVLDDLVCLHLGDQIVADGVVIDADGCEVDESILTGESEPVKKKSGDQVLSGSAVVSGTMKIVTTAVGADSYAQRIAHEAKRFSLAHSELHAGIDKILAVISWGIIPISAILAWAQIRFHGGWEIAYLDGTWRQALVKTVAGVVGMIPQGLVLLTSLNFAVAAMVLARRKILIQQLPAVEVLARVDTLCLDKTGTLTSGQIEADHIDVLFGQLDKTQYAALIRLSEPEGGNATAIAIHSWLENHGSTISSAPVEPLQGRYLPFSSARKYSAISADRTFYLGAPDYLVDKDKNPEVIEKVHSYANRGQRVLVFVESTQIFQSADEIELPRLSRILALIVLSEQLRDKADEILRWFGQEDVDIKIISGDNPATVSAIARRLGCDVDEGVDARSLPDYEKDPEGFIETVESHTVFGRVTPEQKKQFVEALQSRGHTVAMTGDGVNDALALKKADLGIAMGSGAQATKAAAKVVLMDGSYETLPMIVAEGRRVIANMERVAALFLTKTVYASVIALICAVVSWNYPFLPRQLTLIGAFTIGIPAFFLSLPPNSQRYRRGFLRRTLLRAIPAGVIIACGVVSAVLIGDSNPQMSSTRVTMVVVIIALALLTTMTRPLVGWRGGLLAAMIASVTMSVLIKPAREFFMLASLPTHEWLVVILISILGALGVWYACRYASQRI